MTDWRTNTEPALEQKSGDGGGGVCRFIPETGTNGDFPFEQQMHPVNLSLLPCVLKFFL